MARLRLRDLHELSFGERVVLTLVIVLVLLFAIAIAGYLTGGWDEAAGAEPLPPSKYDDRLNELDRDAIETAYKTQIEHLFEVWMKDDRGQPARAVTGARNARRAFIGAMTEIDKRSQR